MDLNQSIQQPHRNEPKTEATTQPRHVFCRLLKSFPGTSRNRHVNIVTDREPCHALMHQRQRIPKFQLDDNRRFMTSQRNDICRPNLGLDDISLFFEKRFDGGIQIGFARVVHKI